MRFDIITLFPDMFNALDYGVVGKAREKGVISFNFWNPRDYTDDPYRKVDDSPYGGGPGMVMLFEPLKAAISEAKNQCFKQFKKRSTVIYLTPQGSVLDQKLANELSLYDSLILLSGRYEGVDERLIAEEVDREISIGDYVLSGGELAAMVLIDAVARKIPGVVGNSCSLEQESFVENLLDYPHYTRPEIVNNKKVPGVLLSGNHAEIAKWRRKQALGRTFLRKPHLLEKTKLTADDSMLLNEFIKENK